MMSASMAHGEDGGDRREEQAESLEEALRRTEAEADTTLKAAASATAALKRVRGAAHVGHLRDLQPAMAAAEHALEALGQQLARARASWTLDEDAYFASGAYSRELLATAERMGVRLFEQDERLYCYPSLVRVLPQERSVLIDRARERRLRPSVLVAHLQALQRKPPRFKPEAFLEALYAAYATIVAKRGKERLGRGDVVPLLEIYELLTLLPGQAREYSRQEFARDVYLLDQSGVTTTRKEQQASFPASTGTKTPGGVLRVITQAGQEKVYYGIAFTRAG